MRYPMLVLGLSTTMLVACGQSTDNAAANQALANAAAAKKERPPYCFFKDSETKAWAASRGNDGNIVVKGKAFRSDSRYQAQIGKTEVAGTTVTVWPTIVPNMTGYGAKDNWWDIKATIPNSAALDTVNVRCGEKLLAELKVKPKA